MMEWGADVFSGTRGGPRVDAYLPFFWAVGIENAHIPEMGVNELSWTDHHGRWREDLTLARALGVSHIRYGLPWAELNPAPGRFDWSWSDAVVEYLQTLGLEPIWDLIHFGAPSWLPGGLRDPNYPAAVADYAGAFAARYRGVVNKLTPFNEPYIAALFRGGLAMWPPYESGREGFVRSLIPIVEGLRGTIQAIRATNPQAEIWQNDAADCFTAGSQELEAEARLLTLERYAGFDLLEGLAGPGSELFELLAAAGFPAEVLERYALDPTPVDVVGLDYYPGSEHRISLRSVPRAAHDWGQRDAFVSSSDPEPAGLAALAATYYERYGKPVFVAETSAERMRHEWLEWTTSECARARAAGVPVIGYTWWPLFDHIDWNTALTRLVGHVCPAGLYRLEPAANDRLKTSLQGAFADMVRAGQPLDGGRMSMPVAPAVLPAGEAMIDAQLGNVGL